MLSVYSSGADSAVSASRLNLLCHRKPSSDTAFSIIELFYVPLICMHVVDVCGGGGTDLFIYLKNLYLKNLLSEFDSNIPTASDNN